MNEEEYKEKYHKYLTKNKLMLAQIRRYDNVQEQQVKFIAISVEKYDDMSENKVMKEIILTNEKKKFRILQTLEYIINRYLKIPNVRKNNRGVLRIVENQRECLTNHMNLLLQTMRGANTIIKFDLSYSYSEIIYDPVEKENKIKMIYIFELLPPEEHNILSFYEHLNTNSDINIPWDIDNHNNTETLQIKWLSCDNSWKWDEINKTWITNDPRPWYFENFPSKDYVLSIDEWNNLLTEVAEHERMKQRVLMNAKFKQEGKKKESDGLLGRIMNFIYQKNKIYVINDPNYDMFSDKNGVLGTDTTEPNTNYTY